MPKAPKPTVKQQQPGFTPVPHSYFSVLISKVSGLAQYFAIGYIIDRTLGVPSKPDWVKLSYATLARLSGLDAKTYEYALDDAVDRGLVERRKVKCDGTCKPNACECPGRDWVYRAMPGAWASAADWERKSFVKEDEPETADAPPEDVAIAADAPPARVVMPGKSSPAVPLSIQPKGAAEPFPLSMRFRNDDLNWPFAMAASVKGDVVTVTVRRGEQTANRNEVEFGFEGARNGEQTANRNEVEFGLPNGRLLKKQRLTEFSAYLNVVFLKYFQKAADPPFIAKVVSAAGEANLDEYSTIVESRVRRAGKGGLRSPGLLLELAKDAARAHAELDNIRARQAEAEARTSRQSASLPRFPVDGDETQWPAIRERLTRELTPETFENWFARSRGEGLSAKGTLLVTVQDQASAEFLTEEYSRRVSELAHSIDPRIERVQFHALASSAQGD